MEDKRLDFIGEHLLVELVLCEKFVRRLFFDVDADTAGTADDPFERLTYDPSKVAVRTVLCNYIYDAYVRLVISEKKRYVERMETAGSLLFLWSVRRAAEMQPDLLRPGQDLATFARLLNNLRRTSSLDILMSEALQFLDRANARAKRAAATLQRPTPTALNGEDSLVLLKTRYDPQFESKFFDHSSHYEEAFVPSHRFCNSRQSVLNMSRYVGYTMRENIRRLYKYVAKQLGDRVCPCVVIFNFFIRDSYRMYYSKSLRQTSFATVFKASEPQAGVASGARRHFVPLSYMIMTNLFPKVGSWFKSINNQLTKKTGKIHIQHLDSFVRLLTQLRYHERERTEMAGTAGKTLGDQANRATNCDRPGAAVAATRRRDKLRKTKMLTRVVGRRGHEIATEDANTATGKFRRPKITGRCDKDDRIGVTINRGKPAAAIASAASAPASATAVAAATPITRVSLSSLYRATDDTLFTEMFSTRFRSCKHRHVVRTYEQMRANDESATLVRICLDCGNRL